MFTRTLLFMGVAVVVATTQFAPSPSPAEEAAHLREPWGKTPLDVEAKPLSNDPSIKIDYDIVYVRAPRFVNEPDGRQCTSRWPEIGHPTNIDPGYDLVVLHPDGSEEVLVAAGKGSVADPYVCFDGQWVYYTLFHHPASGEWNGGADVYKVHAKTRQIVRLTQQAFTPNIPLAFEFRQAAAGLSPHVARLPAPRAEGRNTL